MVGVRAGLLGHTWFDLPLTVLWVMAVVNAFNMIDNHDGIAALVAAMSTLGIAAISISSGYHLVAAFSLAVAGACLGFFVHNKPPATIFLGDAGSMFLGFLVAALALKVDLPEGSWVVRLAVAALLVAVPLFDEALVVVARLREHRPVMLGSTDHSAHRLRALGWSKNQRGRHDGRRTSGVFDRRVRCGRGRHRTRWRSRRCSSWRRCRSGCSRWP